MDSLLGRAVGLAEQAGFAVGQLASGATVITAPAAVFKDYLGALLGVGFSMLTDIVGIDYLTYTQKTPARFAVVYRLVSPTPFEGLHVKVFLNDEQSIPTVTDLFGSADFLEREVFDLFGIIFDDHPNLRKILTPEDLDGHALRKDFPLGESPTLFREGRFIDPAAFRAGLTGQDPGLTGFRGGNRRGFSDDRAPLTGRLDQPVNADNGGAK